jgi:hypothetical protein
METYKTEHRDGWEINNEYKCKFIKLNEENILEMFGEFLMSIA